MKPNIKIGFINSTSVIEDNRFKIWRTSTENSAYDELFIQTFFFLCESSSYFFFIDSEESNLYVVNKKTHSSANKFLFGNSRNVIKGEILDELLNWKLLTKHFKVNYNSYTLIKCPSDMQYGNTIVFSEVLGFYNNTNGELKFDSIISDLLYTCIDSDDNKWIHRDRKLNKLLNGSGK